MFNAMAKSNGRGIGQCFQGVMQGCIGMSDMKQYMIEKPIKKVKECPSFLFCCTPPCHAYCSSPHNLIARELININAT
jgi:hypothetical protein